MWIRAIKPVEKTEEIANNLRCRLSASRFVADITWSHRGWIKILNVRLCHKKMYCGNHGGPCVRPDFGRKHPKMNYLEGADWVEFNDMLNDICDGLEISASIESAVCVIRREYCRRVEYDTEGGMPGREWQRMGHTENWVGQQAPDSIFPEGTPGVYKHNYFCVG